MRPVFLFLALLATSITVGARETISYTDKLGRTVRIEVPVHRAVVFQLYEFLPALRCWDQVVGIGRGAFDKALMLAAKPDLKSNVPSMGSGTDVNVEAIMKLKPDVVLTWTYRPEAVRFMEEKGIKTIAVYPDSLGEIYDVIHLLGRLFDRPRETQKLLGQMNAIFDLVKARAARVPPKSRARVLWIYTRQHSVGGGKSLSNDLITMIGGSNAAAGIPQRAVDVSIETIIRWNPSVVLIWGNAKYSAQEILNSPQWRSVNAVRNRRVYKAPEWSTWSPCLAPIVLWMAAKTYPDLYRDVNVYSVSDKFFRNVFGIPLLKAGRNDF